MDRTKVYISVQMVTVSLGEWWERCREAWAPDSAPNDTFKITLWNSKYHHVCCLRVLREAGDLSRQTSHMQFRVLLSWVICWCAWTTWASLFSDMVPQGWKPTLVTQASSDSSLWRRGMPTYMGMGDNLSKTKGTVTAPPKCVRQHTQGHATLLRAMTQTSSLLNKTKTFPTGSYKWAIVTVYPFFSLALM